MNAAILESKARALFKVLVAGLGATSFVGCAQPYELQDVKMPVYLNEETPPRVPPDYKVADDTFSASNSQTTHTSSTTSYGSGGSTTTTARVTVDDKDILNHLKLIAAMGSTQGGSAVLKGSWVLDAGGNSRAETLQGQLVVFESHDRPSEAPAGENENTSESSRGDAE